MSICSILGMGAMTIDIDKLTEKELIDLNHRIVERLRFLSQMRAHGAMMKFSIGQRVSFTAEDHRTISGTLIKYNRKSVSVVTDDGHRWNVSPTFLRPAEMKDVTPASGNIYTLKPPV